MRIWPENGEKKFGKRNLILAASIFDGFSAWSITRT